MYLLVVPPTPPTPPPGPACQLLSIGCPTAPAPLNPDSLAALLPYLQTEVAAPTWTGAFTKPSGMTGMGDYEHENYNYLFHPPLRTKRTIGGKKSGCGCGCGGGCAKNKGMGQDTSSSAQTLLPDLSNLLPQGSGLFSSGLDLSSWSPTEWLVAVAIGVGVFSIISSTSRGASRAAQSGLFGKKRRAKARRRARAKEAAKAAGLFAF